MGKIWCRRAAAYILRIILPTSLLSQLINSVLYGRSSIDGTAGIWINCVSIIIVCVISACSTRNGQAWSHHFLGLQVVDQYSNLPISGVRMGLREIAHCVDFVPCFIGFLWPLWDTKGQTFRQNYENNDNQYRIDILHNYLSLPMHSYDHSSLCCKLVAGWMDCRQ